jgi:hypothetical protein
LNIFRVCCTIPNPLDINNLSFIDRGFDSRKSGSILSMYGITLIRKNVPLLPQLPDVACYVSTPLPQLQELQELPLTTTLIQQPLFIGGLRRIPD